MTDRKIAGLRCSSACSCVRNVSLAIPERQRGDTSYEGTPCRRGLLEPEAEVGPLDPDMVSRLRHGLLVRADRGGDVGAAQPRDDLRVVAALGQCLEHVGDVNRVVACPAEQELAKREIYCP